MRISLARIPLTILVGTIFLFGSAVSFPAKSAVAVNPATPACAISNFFISGRQSDGGAGTYDTYVYLTNSGPTCRLTPIGARAYNAVTHQFVGTTASISKPEVGTNQIFPYATTHLLGTVQYGQSVSLLLTYTDVSPQTPHGCGKIVTADSMAFWISGRPQIIKVVHLVFYLRGWTSRLSTCSAAPYLGVWWPSVGPFWFTASSPR